MNIKPTNFIFKLEKPSSGLLLGLCGAVLLLSACSNEPATWTKSSSPWEKSSSKSTAPAAQTYKADLEMPVEPLESDAQLTYQPEQVDSFAPAAAVEPAAELEPMADELAADGSIMEQPASYFTVQLMASIEYDRVSRFAEENQISTQYIVATEREGVIWYVLLLDVYPDYSAAVAARDEIATSLKNEPWIRNVGSVQKLVIQ